MYMCPALAKIGYMPGEEFMGLFARTCTAMQLQGFTPQGLANIINGGKCGPCLVKCVNKSMLCVLAMGRLCEAGASSRR
jgi:hypothetical protein